jgi:hypothetical protein
VSSGIRSCGQTRRGLQVEDIHGRGLHVEQERSGILLVLWKDTKGRKDGCSGAVFMGIHLGQGSFGRRTGDQF